MPEQNQPVNTLPIKTPSEIAATDYLLGIGSAEEYQMLIQDLGDYIIQHATSLLAGQSQTLANVISTLNGNPYTTLHRYPSSGWSESTNLLTEVQRYWTSFPDKKLYACVLGLNNTGEVSLLVYRNANYGTVVANHFAWAESIVLRNSNGTWNQYNVKNEIDAINARLTCVTKTVDLNTLTTSGYYYILGGSANRPVNVNGLLSVFTYADASRQLYSAYDTSNVYVRVKDSTGWHAWEKMATQSQIEDLNNKQTVIALPSADVTSSNDIYALYDARSNGESFRQKIVIAQAFDGFTGGAFILEGYRNSANYGWIHLSTYEEPYGNIYTNVKTNGVWSGWKLVPTRAEVDTLNSKLVPSNQIDYVSTAFTTSYASLGKSFVLTKTSLVKIMATYTNSLVTQLGCKASDTAGASSQIYSENTNKEENVGALNAVGILSAGTYYVWGAAKSAGSNFLTVTAYPMQ